VTGVEVGAVLLFAIPIAIVIVLAFVFLARRDAFARALCVIFQLFAYALLYSMHQYLLALQADPFLGLVAGWACLIVVVVIFLEAVAWVTEQL